MYYKFEEKNRMEIPEPFHRYITPIYMGDESKECAEAGFSVHMTEWPKGGQVDEHSHPASTEVMFCIAGHGKCYLEGEEYDFVPGSMIAAGPGVVHKIVNDHDELLRAVCIFSPPNTASGLRGRAMDAKEKDDEENGR